MTDYQAVVEALSRPASYPERPREVQHLQTHVSHLFLTPGHVYKLKKPVDLGFLDFSTFEKRRAACHRELILNRRISPDVYLDVDRVTRGPDGLISVNGQGEALEHLVRMRRLPEERSLATLLATNRVTEEMVRDLARTVGEFHLRAARGPEIARYGSREAIAFSVDENFRQTEGYIGRTIEQRAYERIRSYSQRFLRERGALFEERLARRRIRDCHGDLHAAQVFFTDRGVRIIDCIEFADRLRCIDVASDAAFMAMDLDHAGRFDLSRAFVSTWSEIVQERAAGPLLDFYKVYRAYVRGKVESIRLEDPGVPDAEKGDAARQARSYFSLAYFYGQRRSRPALMLSTGLIGTGKSTLARHLAGAGGFAVFSSDIMRKRLAGVPPDSRNYSGFEAGLYTPEFTRRTYQALLDEARPLLREGHSVVLDATFGKRWQREAAAALAEETGAEYWVAECTASEREVRERLHRRQQRGGGVSDGRWDIYIKERAGFEPIDEIGPDRHLVARTSGRSVKESVRMILSRVGLD